MASGVIDAANGLSAVIVSSAADVRSWAALRGLVCIDDPGTLNAAAAAGVAWARARGFDRAIVAHSDLPLARSFGSVIDGFGGDDVVLVRCNRDRGTPVLAIPVLSPFRFAYGPNSFDRHLREACRRRLPVHHVTDPALATDLDTPEDLRRLVTRCRPLAQMGGGLRN